MKEVTTVVFTLEELHALIDSRIQEALDKHTAKIWMNEKEAQAYTGFSQFTLYNARMVGKLKASKSNRSIRYHCDNFDVWLNSKES